MRVFVKALLAAALITPLLVEAADAAAPGGLLGGLGAAGRGGGGGGGSAAGTSATSGAPGAGGRDPGPEREPGDRLRRLGRPQPARGRGPGHLPDRHRLNPRAVTPAKAGSSFYVSLDSRPTPE